MWPNLSNFLVKLQVPPSVCIYAEPGMGKFMVTETGKLYNSGCVIQTVTAPSTVWINGWYDDLEWFTMFCYDSSNVPHSFFSPPSPCCMAYAPLYNLTHQKPGPLKDMFFSRTGSQGKKETRTFFISASEHLGD